jgi:hypothetical protein
MDNASPAQCNRRSAAAQCAVLWVGLDASPWPVFVLVDRKAAEPENLPVRNGFAGIGSATGGKGGVAVLYGRT